MSIRLVMWLSGFVVGTLAALGVAEDAFLGVRPIVLGSTLVTVGTLGEVLHARRARAATESAAGRRDRRAADGRVEYAALPGLVGETNPFHPAVARFERREDPTSVDPTEANRDSVGRTDCPPLLGRVVVVSVFLGRHGRTWADTELADAHAALVRAGAWLEREATRYRAAVNIEIASIYFVSDDDEADEVEVDFVPDGDRVEGFDREGTNKALVRLTRAASRLGFRDAPSLARAVEARAGADVTAWLLHLREAGRSFAVPRDLRAPGGLSVAVCYARETPFPERLVGPAHVDPVTLVHELLHLFGASDKYNQPLTAYAPRSVTTREVMRLDEDRLSRLKIDPGTAAEIGWEGRGSG